MHSSCVFGCVFFAYPFCVFFALAFWLYFFCILVLCFFLLFFCVLFLVVSFLHFGVARFCFACFLFFFAFVCYLCSFMCFNSRYCLLPVGVVCFFQMALRVVHLRFFLCVFTNISYFAFMCRLFVYFLNHFSSLSWGHVCCCIFLSSRILHTAPCFGLFGTQPLHHKSTELTGYGTVWI